MFLPFVFAASLAHALPATNENCGSFEMGAEGTYCITTTDGSQNPDVLYFFHGRKQGEHAWLKSKWTAQTREKWGVDAPAIVTVSFGGNWLLVEKNSRERSGLYNVFANRVLPFMENQIQMFSPQSMGQRFLMGESMGGYNAVQMYLRNHQFFAKAALVCPAISTVSPFAGVKASWRYIKRTGASFLKVFIGHMVTRLFMPDQQAWEQNDPLVLAQNMNEEYPPIFLSVGSEDSYGFQEGTARFVEIAKEKGVHVTWEPTKGGHCSFSPSSVAKFFKHESELVHPVSRDLRAQAPITN
jgi:S-formylglutathione hydrolase FrmB